MRPLTDLEVLALLSAQPVDPDAKATANGEIDAIREARYALERLSADPHYPTAAIRPARAALARVFDLPPRKTDEPLVIELAWSSDAEETDAKQRDRKRIDAQAAKDAIRMVVALDHAEAPGDTIAQRVEALCAEVQELRRNAAAILRADVGPESDRSPVEHFINPADLAQMEADRAAASCSATILVEREDPFVLDDHCSICGEYNNECACDDEDP